MEKDKEKRPGEGPGEAAAPPIGEKQVEEAYQTLLRYRAGKANLEKRTFPVSVNCRLGPPRASAPTVMFERMQPRFFVQIVMK